MKIKTYNCIRNVPKEDWESVLNTHSLTYSHQFWEIMEQCQLNDFSYNYLLFYNNADQAIALTSYYTITTDIAIFAPKNLRSILKQIRCLWPNFLKFKMLECGTPITLNAPLAIGDEKASTSLMKQLGELLIQMAKDHSMTVKKGLRLKKAGNEIVRLLGGREIHPINFKVGGFYQLPKKADLLKLREHLLEARDDAQETVAWVNKFNFPI